MIVQKIFVKDAAYQKFKVLRANRNKRHRYNEFIVEGVKNINEAIKNNWQINSFIFPHREKLSNWASSLLHNVKTKVNYQLTENLMTELSGKEDASELIVIVNMKDNTENECEMSENPMIALFDRPSNKGNLGTLLRSCDALGIEKLIITGHSIDIYDPDVISASMGSFFKIPFIRLSNKMEIDRYINTIKLKYPLLKIVGTTVDTKNTIYEVDMTNPVLFLIGNEASGLNKYFSERSNIMATIPMSKQSSASSFNVSCAATVFFYEANRQRSIAMKNCE